MGASPGLSFWPLWYIATILLKEFPRSFMCLLGVGDVNFLTYWGSASAFEPFSSLTAPLLAPNDLSVGGSFVYEILFGFYCFPLAATYALLFYTFFPWSYSASKMGVSGSIWSFLPLLYIEYKSFAALLTPPSVELFFNVFPLLLSSSKFHPRVVALTSTSLPGASFC